MLFVIYGVYKTFILKNAKTLTKKILGDDINDLNFKKIDFLTVSKDDLINEITLLPFGYDKKVVLVENSEDLFKEKDLSELVEILNLNNEYVDLILTTDSTKINTSCFELVENKKIIELKELTDAEWDKYIIQYIQKRGANIDNDAVLELKSRTNKDIDMLNNEMNKVLNYSDKLTLEDIKLLVNEPLNENSFEMLTFLIENKKEKALKLFKDLQIKNIDALLLISTLSTQIKFLNTVYYLNKIEKKSKDEIAKNLKVSSGRIYYTLKNLKNINQQIIDKAFDDLYNLDKDIKLGFVDKNIGFELFILNFGGK